MEMIVVKNIFKNLDFSNPYNAGASTLLAIKTIINQFISAKEYIADNSLVDATKLTTVEPLTIISKDLLNEEYMVNVNNTLLNLFAAYYMQAVDILTKVQSVEVVKLLDKLNPNRDASGFLATESHPSTALENYKYDLPKTSSLALELDKDDKKQLLANSNLAVGKLISVSIKLNDKEVGKEITANLSVAIRLLTTILDSNSIQEIMLGSDTDKSLIERYHAWRAGRISFIKDLIFCQDLIDEVKKRSLKDESGTVEEIIRRVSNAKKYGALSKNPSLAVASNLFVISDKVAKELEFKLGGKLNNFRTRKKLFEDTYAMIIVVVDREWERVTFYIRNIESYTDLSFKEIKNSGSEKGPDIADILKSLQLGTGPSF